MGSDTKPLPVPVPIPIITESTQRIILETPYKTSTNIKFTTLRSWTLTFNEVQSDVSWIALDKSAGEPGISEVTVVITEPNPSSLTQREAQLRIVSDTAYRIVTIIQPPRPTTEIAVNSVFLNNKKLKLVLGTTQQLVAMVSPNNATNQTIEWRSSDDSIATVDQAGVVRGVNKGIAIISVITDDADKTDTCNVTVVATPESGGQINDWN